MTQAVDTLELREPAMTGMQEMASRMWLPMFLMGAMVLIASLVIGAVQSDLSTNLFEVTKTTREVSPSGSMLDKQEFIETTRIWLPRFQLLGMGLMFSGITFLLATILGNLSLAGAMVQKQSGRRMLAPKPPWSAQLFPMLMMMGLLILIGALVVSIVIAITAGDVFGNPIATVDAAESGSGLLGDFQDVKTFGAWLQPFAFTGLALVLSGIVLALYTISQALRFQHGRIAQMARGAE